MIQVTINVGYGIDALRSHIAWFSAKVSVYAMEMLDRRYDIGSLESHCKI